MFCREDRALLCRRCDYSIHTANKLAEQHERFLLAGVKVALHSSSNEAEQSASGDSAPASLEGRRAKLHGEEEAPCSSKSSQDGVCVPDMDDMASGIGYSKQKDKVPMGQYPQGMRGSSFDMKGKGGFEHMPSWRVDELLDIPGLADGYNLNDIDGLAGDLGDLDYDFLLEVPDMGEQHHQLQRGMNCNKSIHQVPEYNSDDGMGVVPELNQQSTKRQRV